MRTWVVSHFQSYMPLEDVAMQQARNISECGVRKSYRKYSDSL